MADIAQVLSNFAKDHPELAAELGKLAGDLETAAATTAASAEQTAAAEIRSAGLGGLIHRIAKRVLEPLSGPEQDAVAELCGTAPAPSAPAQPAAAPAAPVIQE
jgi:hypothetical protein